jgi:hypothetical protein
VLPLHVAMDTVAFIKRWEISAGSERANKDAFLLELCDVLKVPRPNPATGIPERDNYVFERDAFLPRPGGRGTLGKIDLYKQGCFLLEAKQGSRQESRKLGAALRGTPAWNVAMRDALGQALGYARTLDEPPPFLIVCDVGHCFDLYASFDGTADYRAFPEAKRSRLFVRDLAEHRDLLRTIFLDPSSLDSSGHTTRVTREIAADLAELARDLEASGHPPKQVAPFLMRCIFTLFAEDAGLLQSHLFTKMLRDFWIPHPPSFLVGVSDLWTAMKTGGSFLGYDVRRFGGGLFDDPKPLALNAGQLRRLAAAGERRWSAVEPAIFGTLLERALDPAERHRLGAHFTPREYVERLVKPTVEEPLRREWDLVKSEVRKLVAADREAAAERRLQEFHQDLVHLRVLDPACGSGNFLYVSLDLFKRLESEVVAYLADLGHVQPVLEMQRAAVTPEQFRGIEVERWAKEIADLVLWIGYLQWQVKTYGSPTAVPEPLLRDFGNIECRDAVLTGAGELVRDEDWQIVAHWDGESYRTHPTTGEPVPDESRTVPVYEYPDARKASWPAADFVVGNPPFVGNWRMRRVLGHGYTEALRRVHHDVPESADYVLYWWNHAATLLKRGDIRRFGFITTNSIGQTLARRVLARHMQGKHRLSIVFAVPDHPWTDDEEGADVRIAMTVARQGDHEGVLSRVIRERKRELAREVEVEEIHGKIHSDLSIGPDVAAAVPLRANGGLSCPGVKLHGSGFLVTPEQARALGLGRVPGLEDHVRPYRHGRDLLRRPRGHLVIDLYGLELPEVRERFPAVYQWVLERVKPERDQNRRRSRREKWWLFGECVPAWRVMSRGLERYVTTAETAKHRIFSFLPENVLPDNSLINFALDDAFHLGVLSSRIHATWALAAGGRLGVGNDPRYTKTRCFHPFPFPPAGDVQRRRIRRLGESLDAHRKTQQAAHDDLELTHLYNVLDKERAGMPLTGSERQVHARGLVTVLREIHDELDTAVADAYGWPADLREEEILERLVALNRERAEEERRGVVRWLRPELQEPAAATQPSLLPGTAAEAAAAPVARPCWPTSWPHRVQSIHALIGRGGEWTAEEVASRFRRARRDDVKQVLESLAALGLAGRFELAGTERWQSLRRP